MPSISAFLTKAFRELTPVGARATSMQWHKPCAQNRGVITNATGLAAIGSRSSPTSLPKETDLTIAASEWVRECNPNDNIAFVFGVGHTTDANNLWVEAVIRGYRPVVVGDQIQWLGFPLVQLSIQAGAAAMHTGSLLLPASVPTKFTSAKWADTIHVVTDWSLSPGARVIHNAADAIAMVVLDRIGYPRVGIEGSATKQAAEAGTAAEALTAGYVEL